MRNQAELPRRPGIPLALYVLIAVVAVERAALGAERAPLWTIALALGLAFSLAAWWYVRRRAVLLTCVACAMACAVALVVTRIMLAGMVAFSREMSSTSVATWEFEVCSDPTTTVYGKRCRAVARKAGAVSGTVWLRGDDLPARGSLLRGIGRYAPNADDAYGTSSRREGISGSVKLVRVLRVAPVSGLRALPLRVRAWALGVVGPAQSDERALLAGCVLSEKTELDARGLDELFAQGGIAHLVAVSGAHISVVAALLTAVAAQGRLKPPVRLGLVLACSGCFVLVCGAPVSAVRAWLMSGSAACAQLVGRRSDGTTAVCLVALGMALVNPGVSGNVGYLLSVSCVLALTIFGSYASYVVTALIPTPPVPRFVSAELRIRVRKGAATGKRALGAALVCQLASAPLALPLFARLSLVGPFATLLATAPVTLMMGFGLTGILLSWAGVLGRALLACADFWAAAALAIVRVLVRLPFASVPVEVSASFLWFMVLAVACTVLFWWPPVNVRPVRAVLAITACLMGVTLLRWRFFAPARICVLDVGQGDAILVQDGPSALLVDTGPDGSCAAALVRNHVLHLDAVLITHQHDDHYGGLGELKGTVSVGSVIVADGVAQNLCGELDDAIVALVDEPPVELAYGDALKVGGFVLRMVSPVVAADGDENSESLMLAVAYRSGERQLTALLTGDAEHEELASVLARGDVGDIDFLKVGHHGSEESLTAEEADALAVELAVASAGKDNSYGHPSDACVDTLEDTGATFLCTKDVGDVEVVPEREGISYRCQTPGS